MKNKYSNIYSLSTLVYTLIIIIVAAFILSKNDEKKYIKYLINTGVFKKKRRSIRMDQSITFTITHKKLSKISEKCLFEGKKLFILAYFYNRTLGNVANERDERGKVLKLFDDSSYFIGKKV